MRGGRRVREMAGDGVDGGVKKRMNFWLGDGTLEIGTGVQGWNTFRVSEPGAPGDLIPGSQCPA